jgi:hypothetical protein
MSINILPQACSNPPPTQLSPGFRSKYVNTSVRDPSACLLHSYPRFWNSGNVEVTAVWSYPANDWNGNNARREAEKVFSFPAVLC